MQMRLGFAVAVHVDADILLIDEVLSVGDLAFERKCVDRIGEFRSEGRTILFASHDTSLVADLCDKVLWFDAGRLAANGPAPKVVSEYLASYGFPQQSGETRRRTPEYAPVARTPSGTELRLHVNRLGSLELELGAVRLFDARGPLAAAADCVGELRIEMDFVARAPIAHPIFQVCIHRDGSPVYRQESTLGLRVIPETVRGTGTVVLELGEPCLREGLYWVEVGAYASDWSYAYDYHWDAYSFRAPSSHGFATRVPGRPRWRLEVGAAANVE
jgi:homopolymeric O-antigen transport system ATP-binding protein